jgi:arylamine N-acetyltransferase
MASPTSAYTTEQISVYLELINLPKRFWPAANPPLDLELLTALHVHSISTVPYENLSLHYSPSREISLEPQRIYEKFMRNGRGGYCFEHGIFFNNILGAFGFSAYMTGVRIRLRVDGEPIGDYTGW